MIYSNLLQYVYLHPKDLKDRTIYKYACLPILVAFVFSMSTYKFEISLERM